VIYFSKGVNKISLRVKAIFMERSYKFILGCFKKSVLYIFQCYPEKIILEIYIGFLFYTKILNSSLGRFLFKM